MSKRELIDAPSDMVAVKLYGSGGQAQIIDVEEVSRHVPAAREEQLRVVPRELYDQYRKACSDVASLWEQMKSNCPPPAAPRMVLTLREQDRGRGR